MEKKPINIVRSENKRLEKRTPLTHTMFLEKNTLFSLTSKRGNNKNKNNLLN
jgi:hypothetical protein